MQKVIKRTRGSIINKICPYCKEIFPVRWGLRRQIYCSHDCANKNNAQENGNKQRFSGKSKKHYIKFNKKGLHRVILEKKIGRKLRKNEIAHHIDGNRQNNSPNNLEVMNRSKHVKHHNGLKIEQFSLENKFINVWDSIRDICKKYKISRNHLSKVIKRENNIHHGYIWKLVK